MSGMVSVPRKLLTDALNEKHPRYFAARLELLELLDADAEVESLARVLRDTDDDLTNVPSRHLLDADDQYRALARAALAYLVKR